MPTFEHLEGNWYLEKPDLPTAKFINLTELEYEKINSR